MRRPRPIRRLVDGRPDDSGRTISRRLTLLMTPAISLVNAVGATVVLFVAVYVVPLPDIGDQSAALVANFVAFGVFLGFAVFVGVVWGYQRLKPVRDWLRADRAPSQDEQRLTLRAPRRILLVNAFLWALAVVVFTAVNVAFAAELALVVSIVIVLGGATTSAVAYLIAERLLRPVVARALRQNPPEKPLTASIVTRSLAAWALGSGVPVFGLVLVAIASLADFDVNETQLAVTSLCLGGVSLAVGLLMTYQAARGIADPVVSTREALNRVEQGDFDAEVPVFDGSELGLMQSGFNRMAEGLREREEIRELFGRQVGTDVAKAAMEQGTEMGGETREVAVLFTDIVGSTSLAQDRPPHEVVDMLNEFFAVVVKVVEEHGGWINKFEGDAALAVFGAPIALDDAADRALAAARDLAGRVAEDVPDLRAGIGVSGGTALAGNVGAEQRFEYTVIGDPVNEAARLTELAKEDDGCVLASFDLVEQAGQEEAAHWERGDEAELRGRSQPTQLARPQRSGSAG
ncbi:MAG TPA: adenylate/guanylate cyclase domain-containing protein [Thermoleophilaceae bacterium]|nr:adenylate/guanylate cyclase domain-containing protein [Thermoleophilaceae bacterium]